MELRIHDLVIRQVEVADIPQMLAIAQDNYPKLEEQDFIFDLIKELDNEIIYDYYCVEYQEKVIAFAALKSECIKGIEGKGMCLTWLNVKHEFKNQGIAQYLRISLRKIFKDTCDYFTGKCLPYLKDYYEKTGAQFIGTKDEQLIFIRFLNQETHDNFTSKLQSSKI